MDANVPSIASLMAENAELRLRLSEAEETLRAIRDGEVDALVVQSVMGPKIFALQGQDAETMRFRGEMLAQVSDAVIAVDNEVRIIYLNLAAERLYNTTASEALGRRQSEVYASRWRYPEDEAAANKALMAEGEWRGENLHIRHDGRAFNVESSVTALRDAHQQITGRLAVIRDVTERKQHETKVLVSETRYRRLFETAHDGILILDPTTRKIIDANPYMTQMLGYSHQQFVGKELFEIGLLEDEADSQDMVQKLKRSGQVRYEGLPLKSIDGHHHEVEVVANLYDEEGRPVIQCNIRDITERRRSEEHVKLLMAEVNHRAKNLLAVVQAVANQTAKHGDPETFSVRLSERIFGLAVGHDLLVKNQWHGVDVSELVEAQLSHFKDLIGTRVRLTGPPLRLTAEAAQGIGMALHELSTNAAKYGALSNQAGRVNIDWNTASGAAPTFSMSWVEEDGPNVVPPTRKGFGQTVIGRLVEASVMGKAEIAFEASGVIWTLMAPIANVHNLTGAAIE